MVDWRKLYAANRAVIEGRASQAESGSRKLATSPGRAPVPDLPGRRAVGRRGALRSTTRGPSGTWQQRTHTDGRSAPRPYFVYTPPSARPGASTPLVVMLHGCTQTAAGSAAGTLMNAAADRHGFVVAYPQQGREHNPQGCWNWFAPKHQARGAGEPAFVAGVARAVIGDIGTWTIDPGRVLVAGMSAGGAMAAVMGATYPDLFTAIAIHSGIAFRSAASYGAAFAAMSRGAPDTARQGELALRAMGDLARPIPTFVIHGGADRLVATVNGDDAVRQWMVTNRLADGSYDADFERPSTTARDAVLGGHSYVSRRWTDRRGHLVQEYVVVEGLGHAWSGGARGEPYADPRGPSAADAIWRFLGEVTSKA